MVLSHQNSGFGQKEANVYQGQLFTLFPTHVSLINMSCSGRAPECPILISLRNKLASWADLPPSVHDTDMTGGIQGEKEGFSSKAEDSLLRICPDKGIWAFPATFIS